jgi:hypothetical protein
LTSTYGSSISSASTFPATTQTTGFIVRLRGGTTNGGFQQRWNNVAS